MSAYHLIRVGVRGRVIITEQIRVRLRLRVKVRVRVKVWVRVWVRGRISLMTAHILVVLFL